MTHPASVVASQGSARETKPLDQWLDLFRWLAAFMVLFTHTTNRFMVPVSDATIHKSYIYYIASFLSGFSHQAVMVFFVLSGFLVGGGLIREYQSKGEIDVRLYLIKRFARLWTVLVPACILGLAANWIAFHFYPATAIQTYPLDLPSRSNILTFFCNLAFLQTAACYPFAANGPLWSLFNEFWYYITWLMFFPLIFFPGRLAVRLLNACIGLAVLFGLTYWQFTGSSVGPYMSIWLLGVLASAAPRPPIRSSLATGCLLLVFLLGLRLGVRREFWDDHPGGTFGLDFTLAAIFALMLVAMKTDRHLRNPPGGRHHITLAGFSFSLYCIHGPLLNLYGVAVANLTGLGLPLEPRSASDWATLLLPMAIMPAVAFLFSLGAEQQTARIRRFAERLFPPSSSTSPSGSTGKASTGTSSSASSIDKP